MIEANTLAKTIEDGLNSNAFGVVYKIYSDMGTYAESLNDSHSIKSFTNGVLQITSSAIIPTQTLTIATQSAQLEICVPLPREVKQEEVVRMHRSILDSYFSSVRVQALTDESGKIFTVSSSYTLAETGITAIRGTAGTSLVFLINIAYSFIQNGLNSFNCIFELDGVIIPYTTASITRVPTVANNPYSDSDGRARSITTATSMSFELQVPATTDANGLSDVLLKFILSGDINETHTLTVKLGDVSRTYTVIFGQTAISVDGINNAGQTISLIEAASSLEVIDGSVT